MATIFRQEIKIRNQKYEWEAQTILAEIYGPLAVHSDQFTKDGELASGDRFTVTHIKTGVKVKAHLPLRVARRYAKALAADPGFDWTVTLAKANRWSKKKKAGFKKLAAHLLEEVY